MKMEQYPLGEQFVDQVVEQRGIAFAEPRLAVAEALPTEAEIRDAGRWIARMEAAQAG